MDANFEEIIDQDVRHFSVSLLMADLQEAKRVTDIFKQLGIVPDVCKTEAEFLSACEKDKPHFSIVDVKKMSPRFFEHKLIANDQLAIAFYYQLGSKPLLSTTYDIFNYGYINGHQELTGQIKSILNRFNHMDSFRSKATTALELETSYEDKLGRIATQVQKLKEKDFYHSFFKSICARLENEKSADDFLTATSRVFSNIKEIQTYTFLELSTSGHKLISPKLYFDKYKEIPSLWLGRSCAQGIEFFAQNMASQVCLELIGGDLMSLLIKGHKSEPDFMLFLKVEDEDFINHFDWESFELYLSGLYTHFKLKEKSVGASSSEFANPWSLFSFVDEIGNGVIPESHVEGGYDRYSMIKIDFRLLVDKALGNIKQRFFWQKFYTDFFSGFEARHKVTFKLYSYGLNDTVMLIDRESEDDIKQELVRYSRKYPYWRYFEQGDLVLNENFVPEISFISTSLISLIGELEGGKTIKTSHSLEKEIPESLIRSAPNQSM